MAGRVPPSALLLAAGGVGAGAELTFAAVGAVSAGDAEGDAGAAAGDEVAETLPRSSDELKGEATGTLPV